MSVRLTVIGSSPAWPNPGSAQSGYLLEAPPDAGRLLLDCGPGVLCRLREGGSPRIDAVAITHFHLDHWGDLVPWAWLNLYGPGRGTERPELWLPPGGCGELATFGSHWGNEGMFEKAFRLCEFDEGTAFTAAGFTIEPRRLAHYELRSYGFRVSADGKTLAYSGDTGPSADLAELARGADLFLVEATLAEGVDEGQPRGHLSAGEALAAADGRVLLTHRPAELPPPDGIPLAHDGLVVEIG